MIAAGNIEIKEVIKIDLITLFFVSIFPGIIWVWYFYRQDRYDPEPKKLIIRDFIYGILIVFPVSLIETPFSGLIGPETPLLTLLFGTIFVVGFVEEGAKAYVVYKLHYNHPDFDEEVDGIIYGVTVGLGFAAFENLFYTMMFGYQVGLVRAVLTNLAHASFTGIFGYYLSRAKQQNNRYYIIFGYILVSLLHGIYDFLVIGGLIGMFYTVLTIIILQLYLASLIRGAVRKSPFK